MQHESIYQLFKETVRADPDGVAYQQRKNERWVDLSWVDTARTVRRISGALIALGVEHGDRVAILSRSRLEWMLLDLGIAGCGSVTVGIYPSNLAPECRYILDHADAVLLVVENRDQLEKILSVRRELPDLRRIVILDGDGGDDALSWEAFLALGDETSEEDVARRGEAIRGDDLAALVYTSGTTGTPKGVMITHNNMLFTAGSACGCIPIERHFTMLLFLPLAHVFARLMVYCCLLENGTVAFVEDLSTVARDIKEVRPHWIPSAPRIYEKVHEGIMKKTDAAGGAKRKLFDWAVGVGHEVSERQLERRSRTAAVAPASRRCRQARAAQDPGCFRRPPGLRNLGLGTAQPRHRPVLSRLRRRGPRRHRDDGEYLLQQRQPDRP